jgi:hypothetical protein
MKVIVENVTGSVKKIATLYKESGVLEYEDGEFSTLSFEKQFNKSVKAYIEPVAIVTDERKEPRTSKTTKRKS